MLWRWPVCWRHEEGWLKTFYLVEAIKIVLLVIIAVLLIRIDSYMGPFLRKLARISEERGGRQQ